MPNILYGNAQRVHLSKRMEENKFDYQYPSGLDLTPGSKQHNAVLDLVLEFASQSSTVMSQRHSTWKKMDESLTGYMIADEAEALVKQKDVRKPISIVYPYSYAILETLLAYMMAAFFRDPIFRYEGYGPEDVMGSILLEKVVQLHCIKNKVMLNLHTMFRDAFVYGSGIVAPTWKHRKNFSGNALLNIDPYRFLPDNNVAADKLQDGEFNGWTSDDNYVNLLEEEYSDPKNFFNTKYLSLLEFKGTSIYSGDNSGRNSKSGAANASSDARKPITEINMYAKIIPSDHGLGDSDRPEIWFFSVAGDAIVRSCRPANFEHGLQPITSAVPDFDGYSSSPIGRLEILYGMQETLDWLLNTHIANVRKAVNDTLIYDPSLINTKDLRDPKPGGLIRMRRQAWGQGRVSDAVHQLQINDVTRGNVADSGWIINSMQTLMGTDDATMGTLRQGGPERLTKAEFQGTATGTVSRLERIAKITGMQAMQDIGEFFGSHAIQTLDQDTYVKVTGRWQDILMQEYQYNIDRGRMTVSPKDLDIAYDAIVRDGSIPGNNYSEIWVRMFDILSKQPELAQNFDTVKIFKYIARNAGAKNVDEFVRRGAGINQQVASDGGVQAQAQQGNLVPLREVL